MRRRTALSLACCLALALAAAPAASAAVVFTKDGGIWAMNDDGSGQRQLISQAQVPGATNVPTETHIAPNGDTIIFSAATDGGPPPTRRLYILRGGQVTPLTGNLGCGQFCEEAEPELAASGRYVHTRVACPSGCASGVFVTLQYSQLGTGGLGGYNSNCNTENPEGNLEPTPNPANPDEIAFACNQGGAYLGFSSDPSGQPGFISYPVNSVTDPGWRPDGQRVAFVASHSTFGGLHIADRANPSSPQFVLASPNVRHPRFMGNDTLLFEAGGRIYSLPASCTAQTCGPQNAKELAIGGYPAWTSASFSAVGGPGAGGPGGGGGVGAAISRVTAPRSLSMRQAFRSGVPVTVVLNRRGDVTAELLANSRLLARNVVLGRRGRRGARPGRVRLRVPIARKHRRKLARRRRAKLTVRVTVRPAGGARERRTRGLTLKR